MMRNKHLNEEQDPALHLVLDPQSDRNADRFHILVSETLTPERCLEAYHLRRTPLELIAERKVRRNQLTDDRNVEITGRDLRERELRARRPIGYRRAASREPHNKPFGMPSTGSLSG